MSVIAIRSSPNSLFSSGMGSSMTKSRRCEYKKNWQRSSKGDVGSHFSKEYAEYWRRPASETGAKFSMDKNEYSYATQED
ncbi:hypothetical protein OESDEN_06800, partial [Oesophagostomum dentatum]